MSDPMLIEFPDGFLKAARDLLSEALACDVMTDFAAAALKASSRNREPDEVNAEAIAYFLSLGQDLGILNFEQVYGRPLRSGRRDLPKPPPPRRRHRRLGANVVDLVATRREREDAEVVF